MSNKHPPDLGYQRLANLRQRLLRASRLVNSHIVEGLHEKGFVALRSTHTALLSHLDLDGTSLTEVARRAGMSKQAMGRLAEELISLDYIKTSRDETDRRVIKLAFTDTGLDLMQHSFEVMDEIERRCAKRIGKKEFQQLLDSLSELATELEEIKT